MWCPYFYSYPNTIHTEPVPPRRDACLALRFQIDVVYRRGKFRETGGLYLLDLLDSNFELFIFS